MSVLPKKSHNFHNWGVYSPPLPPSSYAYGLRGCCCFGEIRITVNVWTVQQDKKSGHCSKAAISGGSTVHKKCHIILIIPRHFGFTPSPVDDAYVETVLNQMF